MDFSSLFRKEGRSIFFLGMLLEQTMEGRATYFLTLDETLHVKIKIGEKLLLAVGRLNVQSPANQNVQQKRCSIR